MMERELGTGNRESEKRAFADGNALLVGFDSRFPIPDSRTL
jgi:hypothetical protein